MEHCRKRPLAVGKRCVCPINIMLKIDSLIIIIIVASVKHTYTPCTSSPQSAIKLTTSFCVYAILTHCLPVYKDAKKETEGKAWPAFRHSSLCDRYHLNNIIVF